MMDNSGRTWKYKYLNPDANNSRVLSSVELPTGQEWKYVYSPGPYYDSGYPETPIAPLNDATATSRQLIGIAYPTGGKVSYEYKYYYARALYYKPNLNTHLAIGGARVSKRSLSTGGVWSYEYARGGVGQLDSTKVSGPDGVSTSKYMGAGYASADREYGNSLPYAYQNNSWKIGSLIEKIDALGNTERYEWQPRKVTDGRTYYSDIGRVWDDAVYAADLKKKVITLDGATYTTEYSNYDIYGNPGSKLEAGPSGEVRSTNYTYLNDASEWIIGKLKTAISSSTSVIKEFDSKGNVLSESRDGVVVSYTYDSEGNLASKTMPGGGVYKYSSYKRGVAQSESHPEGVVINRVVSDAGNITSESNGESKTTYFTYDDLNRILSIAPPLGNLTTIVYAATSKVINRGGTVEKTQYDSFGRVASVDRGGVVKNFSFDEMGRKKFESNPNSAVGTTYQYDAKSRVVRVINSDASFKTISYGASSRTIVDERGKSTTFSYRSYGDPEEQYVLAIAAPESSASISITRNVQNLLESVTQAGFTRTYSYDAHNYLARITDPEIGDTIYGRDIEGNMISRSVGGAEASSFVYDKLNRLTKTVNPGLPPVIYVYNKQGEMLSASSDGGDRKFYYNDNGSLIREELLVDDLLLGLNYSYDGNDQLASIEYPISNRVVKYDLDQLGRPSKIYGFLNSIKYWPSGQLQGIAYANNTVTNYDQNARLWAGDFVTYKDGDSAFYMYSRYGYDATGNLTEIIDNTNPEFSRTMTYDGISRLTGVSGPWGNGSITYSGSGNILSQVFGASNLSYVYDNKNRLGSVSGARSGAYSYDAYGNITQAGNDNYIYDSVPNLRCVNCTDTSKKVEYTYDGINMRSSVSQAGVKTIEMYDVKGKPLIEYTPSQKRLLEYIYLGDKRVAQVVSHPQ